MKQHHIVRFSVIFFVVAVVSFIRWWFFYNQSLTGIDDANIFFVYAKNLAEGHGLVYNEGGETVEGFTSLLWVIILSLFYQTGKLEILIHLFNLLLISFTLYRLSIFTDSLSNFSKPLNRKVPGVISWAIIAFICLIPGYIDWTVLTLMETGLWSSLLVLCCLALSELFLKPENKKRSQELLVLIPLLIITRPESIAWGLVFIAIRLGQLLFFHQKVAVALKKIYPLLAAYIIPLGLLITFRLSYFGYIFPNTYYAKMSGTLVENLVDGAYYLSRYVKENPFIPLFVALLGVALVFIVREIWLKKNKVSSIQLLQGSIILCVGFQFLIPFYTGGDHFYLSRFMQPLYPVLLLGVFNGKFWAEVLNLKSFQFNRLREMAVGVAAFLLILIGTRFSFFEPSPIYKEFAIAEMGREAGVQLNNLFAHQDQYPTVATYLAGGIAYVYKGHTIDMLGLNNTLMAHAPKENNHGHKNHSSFNKAVFYQLEPDILHIEFLRELQDARLNEHDSTDFQNQIYNFLFLDETFRNKYEPVVLATPSEDNWYQAYVNKKYLPVLKEENHKIYVLSREKNLQQIGDKLLLQLSFSDKVAKHLGLE